MNIDSLKTLWVHELKDLHSAERQIVEALPKIIEHTSNDELRKAFQEHLGQTKQQVKRLDKIFAKLEYKPGGQRCKGMEGLLEEGDSLIEEIDESDVLDAALISAAQRVEHYEIAAYGSARAFAEKLGEHEAAELLTESLEEEGQADRLLTQIASRRINFEAMVEP